MRGATPRTRQGVNVADPVLPRTEMFVTVWLRALTVRLTKPHAVSSASWQSHIDMTTIQSTGPC